MEDTSFAETVGTGRGREARSRLIEAAIGQLADGGMRALTHRRVEHRAGLAQGSAKYYFGTLAALVEAVLQHLVDTELPLVLEVGAEERAAAAADPDLLLERAQRAVDEVLRHPDRARARFHLYLHAAGDPDLQARISAARDRFVARIAESLPGPGAEAGARFVVATIDGMLFGQVCVPDPTVAAHAARYVVAAGATAAALARERPHPRG